MAGALLNFLNHPGRNLRRLSYLAGGQAALCYNLRKSLKECDDKTSYSTPLVAWRTEPK